MHPPKLSPFQLLYLSDSLFLLFTSIVCKMCCLLNAYAGPVRIRALSKHPLVTTHGSVLYFLYPFALASSSWHCNFSIMPRAVVSALAIIQPRSPCPSSSADPNKQGHTNLKAPDAWRHPTRTQKHLLSFPIPTHTRPHRDICHPPLPPPRRSARPHRPRTRRRSRAVLKPPAPHPRL